MIFVVLYFDCIPTRQVLSIGYLIYDCIRCSYLWFLKKIPDDLIVSLSKDWVIKWSSKVEFGLSTLLLDGSIPWDVFPLLFEVFVDDTIT